MATPGMASQEAGVDNRPYTDQLRELLGEYYDGPAVDEYLRSLSMKDVGSIRGTIDLLRADIASAESDGIKEELRRDWISDVKAVNKHHENE